jgi:Cu/Ag efflux pump CusA
MGAFLEAGGPITTQTGDSLSIARTTNAIFDRSACDRDLQSTVEEAQARLTKEVRLPNVRGMAGQYEQLKAEQNEWRWWCRSLSHHLVSVVQCLRLIKNALLV